MVHLINPDLNKVVQLINFYTIDSMDNFDMMVFAKANNVKSMINTLEDIKNSIINSNLRDNEISIIIEKSDPIF